jgi:hypothetical protein
MNLVLVYQEKWSKCINQLCKYDNVTESDLVNCACCEGFVSNEMKQQKDKLKVELKKWW